MMRVVAILLLVALALQTFQQTYIMVDYQLNTETFAQNCENKDRPVLRCKGKCQMMKKLQAEEQKKEQHPEHKTENRAEVLYAALHLPVVAPPVTTALPIHFPRPEPGVITGRSYPIFHPPALG